MRASVSQLVLHREPFFFLVKGLRFLKRLKTNGHDASLTIQLKPRFVIWMYLIVSRCFTAIGSLLASFRILVLYSWPFFMAYKGLCRMESLAFRVDIIRSVRESLSLSDKSQVHFNRYCPLSCFAQRTVLHGI
jgi:hypothetical protein